MRRRGLLAAGGALTLGLVLGRAGAAQTAAPGKGWQKPGQPGLPVGIWVVVNPDDTYVVRIARSEMGQGTLTGLAQLVIEEMEGEWSRVRAELVPPHVNYANKRAWGDMSTGGSRGLRTSVDYVRQGGAAARVMLVQAAATRWGVPAAECRAEKGAVLHQASGRSARFGALATEAAALPVPAAVPLKPESAWTIIGQPLPRLDTAEKLNGALQYAIDVKLPGMLCAALAQAPVFGATLIGFEAAPVLARPGVRHVLAVGDGAVAVVADTWWQAKTALDALVIRWDETKNGGVDSAAIAARMAEGLAAGDAGAGHVIGDAPAALKTAAKTIEATYATPFLNHATLEPMNCTARVDADSVEVWVGTQNGDASLAAAAEAAGLKLEQARVNKYTLGGGFGRRGQQDYVRLAVAVARQVPGVPVKVLWSREEDMQHCFYRPASLCRMVGGLDAKGDLVALHMRVAGQSINAWLRPDGNLPGTDLRQLQGLVPEEFGYLATPNLLIDYAMRNTHVPVGPWRGVNLNQNAVYLECFIDELAHEAGRDPLAFRQGLMAKNPLHWAVLKATAERAGWGKPLPAGVFRGIAQNYGYGSYTAAVAEVSVTPKGVLTIHRITAGTDSGHVVNPDQVRAQVEGSFVFGLSACLYSEITVDKGRVVEGNFDSYEVMRMADMPAVDTIMVPSGGFWGGVGEPTIAVAAPAVLNAVFAATGKRVRSLPLKNHDLSHA
ncbi:MAG: molybdopterin cofactor-binding domain-containing protein [Janthinobacterium lividum]